MCQEGIFIEVVNTFIFYELSKAMNNVVLHQTAIVPSGFLQLLPCENVKPTNFPFFFANGIPLGSATCTTTIISQMRTQITGGDLFHPQEIQGGFNITCFTYLRLHYYIYCTFCFETDTDHPSQKLWCLYQKILSDGKL